MLRSDNSIKPDQITNIHAAQPVDTPPLCCASQNKHRTTVCPGPAFHAYTGAVCSSCVGSSSRAGGELRHLSPLAVYADERRRCSPSGSPAPKETRARPAPCSRGTPSVAPTAGRLQRWACPGSINGTATRYEPRVSSGVRGVR